MFNSTHNFHRLDLLYVIVWLLTNNYRHLNKKNDEGYICEEAIIVIWNEVVRSENDCWRVIYHVMGTRNKEESILWRTRRWDAETMRQDGMRWDRIRWWGSRISSLNCKQLLQTEVTSPEMKSPSYSAPSLQTNLPMPCIIPFINTPSYLQPLSECAHPT